MRIHSLKSYVSIPIALTLAAFGCVSPVDPADGDGGAGGNGGSQVGGMGANGGTSTGATAGMAAGTGASAGRITTPIAGQGGAPRGSGGSSGTSAAAGSGGRAGPGGGGTMVGSAGTNGSGGRRPGGGGMGAGGSTASAGAAGKANSGGSGTGTCTEGNRTVTANGIEKHCGYTYEYWKDQGTGTLTLTPEGFNVEWSNINNLLGRKGRRPGSADLIVQYEANYQPNGNSYLCVYGWTRNPLVEYYIVDGWGNWRPPGGEGYVGKVSSDGGSYDIYKVPRTGANIDGNSGSFTQYWSVRTEKKTSGTITVGNHFDAWKNNGMPMGSFYEVSMSVEGYQSSGKAEVKFSIQ